MKENIKEDYIRNLIKGREVEERPLYISKMASYLQDKEPLIYLFIINSDFIKADDILGEINVIAGVLTFNGRVKFLYNESMIKNITPEELFFVVIHEAFHIFKKHLQKDEDMIKENHILSNIAQDTIINEEIVRTMTKSVTSLNFRPKPLKHTFFFEKEFLELEEVKNLSRDMITSRRVFSWLKNRKFDKKDLLKEGTYVKIKNKEIYGRIEEINNNVYSVREFDSKEDFTKEFFSKNAPDCPLIKDISKKSENELIPVISGRGYSKSSSTNNEDDCDAIIFGNLDIHFNPSRENDSNIDEIEMGTEVFTKKIFNQAKELEETFNNEIYGGNSRGALTKLLKNILEPKIDWKKELRKNLNIFFTKEVSELERHDSIITYPWNPKSRYGILCKHYIEKENSLSSYVIVAIDTSGSIFCSDYELSTFFSEIDGMSKWLDFSKKGKVLTIQWDTTIQEGLKKYNSGEWKRFMGNGGRSIKGGGGTVPQVVFDYLDGIYKENGSSYKVNEDDIKFTISNKKNLPYLIFLTDGYFFGKIDQKDLKKYNSKNVLFFTKNEDYIPENIKRITYNIV
jgi:predicted metal-dependent peptidase